MSKPFRDRNPVIVGAVSLLVIAMLVAIAFKAGSLPLIGGGTKYYADFSEIGGLKVNDPVRIAGVRVGKIDSIQLASGASCKGLKNAPDTCVVVGFKVKNAPAIGNASHADIKIQTILGQMYLDVVPGGTGSMSGSSTLAGPNTSPYDVVEAFSGLANKNCADTSQSAGGCLGAINTAQLGKALTTLADLQRTTPAAFRDSLKGLSSISRVIAAKDQQIGQLLTSLDKVTQTLDNRDGDIVKLMQDSSVLFEALLQRRQEVHNLLVSTSQLSSSLSNLITKSNAELKPALDQINLVLAVFNKNQANLDLSLRLAAPFYRDFANLLGAGPWFDMFIYNMPPLPALGTVP